jgi:hypothetical protein
VAGTYAAEATNSADRQNDGWLGLYFAPYRRWDPALYRGTISGVLNDCGRNLRAAEAAAGPDTIVMSVGYCHYHRGLNLQSARFRPAGRARFERQLGGVARALFGDLLEASAERAPPAEAVALADSFLAALRSGDAATLRALVTPWSETFERGSREEQQFHTWLLGEGGSPLAEVRAMAGQPQRAWFVERRSRAHDEIGYRDVWHVCFCRTADCSGRWPIAAMDAVAHVIRPYFCLRAINARSRDDPADHLSIERRDTGFLEPDRSALAPAEIAEGGAFQPISGDIAAKGLIQRGFADSVTAS